MTSAMTPPSQSQPAPPGAPAHHALLGHDLRGAMSDVLGGLRQIDQATMPEEARLQLERVRAAGEGLARLMEETLSVLAGDEASDAPAHAPLALDRLLYDAQVRWGGRAREKGLAFRVMSDADLPRRVTLDQTALERVLANFLSNAIKYTDRGEVTLELRRGADGALCFVVTDSGPGFSPEALERLFQFPGRPQGQTRPGSGLGLHISHSMTGRLGGSIGIENLAEGGARATLSLPPDRWSAADDSAEPPLPDLTGLRVLLAEDMASSQMILAEMLAQMGAAVVLACDGIEALDQLSQTVPDLALIDIEMPRLSGLEVIRTIRRAGSGAETLTLIAVTAHGSAIANTLREAGADAILTKPVLSAADLGQAISAARAAHSAPPTAGVADFDPAQLEHLLQTGGAALSQELLARLLADLGGVHRDLAAALPGFATDTIRAQTHILLGLAGTVGAHGLHRLAADLNAAAHRSDAAAGRDLGQAALVALDALLDHLRARAAADARP